MGTHVERQESAARCWESTYDFIEIRLYVGILLRELKVLALHQLYQLSLRLTHLGDFCYQPLYLCVLLNLPQRKRHDLTFR